MNSWASREPLNSPSSVPLSQTRAQDSTPSRRRTAPPPRASRPAGRSGADGRRWGSRWGRGADRRGRGTGRWCRRGRRTPCPGAPSGPAPRPFPSRSRRSRGRRRTRPRCRRWGRGGRPNRRSGRGRRRRSGRTRPGAGACRGRGDVFVPGQGGHAPPVGEREVAGRGSESGREGERRDGEGRSRPRGGAEQCGKRLLHGVHPTARNARAQPRPPVGPLDSSRPAWTGRRAAA